MRSYGSSTADFLEVTRNGNRGMRTPNVELGPSDSEQVKERESRKSDNKTSQVPECLEVEVHKIEISDELEAG